MLMFSVLLGLLSFTASQTLTGISLGKPVQLSSRSSSQGPPEVATDGEYDCSKRYTCTEKETNPWLTIDLQGLHNIHKVQLDLANYDTSETLAKAHEIMVGNYSFATNKNTLVRCGTGNNVFCQPPVLGSQVTIRRNTGQGTSDLCVCEVSVTGTRVLPGPNIRCVDGKWGDKCENDCPVNCKDSRCNREDGACPCEEGYTGERCQTQCPAGTFGLNCSYTCSVGCFDACDHIRGGCSCKPGWYSFKCHGRCSPGCRKGVCDKTDGACVECVTGKSGGHCQYDCPVNCKDSRCSKEEGTCQCKEGYTGDRCQTRRSGGGGAGPPGVTGDHGGGTVSTPGSTGSTEDSVGIGRCDQGLPIGTSILVGLVIAGAMTSITIIVALYCIHRKRAGHVKEEAESANAKVNSTQVTRNRPGEQTTQTSFDQGDAHAHSNNGGRHSYVNYPRNPYETLVAAHVQDTAPNTYQELRDTR